MTLTISFIAGVVAFVVVFVAAVGTGVTEPQALWFSAIVMTNIVTVARVGVPWLLMRVGLRGGASVANESTAFGRASVTAQAHRG